MAWQRDAAKEREWRQQVARWRRSGLTVREYCASERIAEHNFYAWRRVLAQRERDAGRQRASKRRPTAAKAIPSASFLPVRVVSEVSTSHIEIVRNGWVLRVRPGFDAATLRQLLEVLDASATSEARSW